MYTCIYTVYMCIYTYICIYVCMYIKPTVTIDGLGANKNKNRFGKNAIAFEFGQFRIGGSLTKCFWVVEPILKLE